MKITIPVEATSDTLTFTFFEERVRVADQLDRALSIRRDDFRRVIDTAVRYEAERVS